MSIYMRQRQALETVLSSIIKGLDIEDKESVSIVQNSMDSVLAELHDLDLAYDNGDHGAMECTLR